MTRKREPTDPRRESTDPRVVVECDLDEPPETVWRALTVPELLAKWLMPNDICPEVGSRFRFTPAADPRMERGGETGRPQDRSVGPIDCRVLEAEPTQRLRLSWLESDGGVHAQRSAVRSIVTFELSRTTTGGTRLRLVHEGFERVASTAIATNVIQLPRRERCAAPRTRKPTTAMLNTVTWLRRAA